MISGSVVKNLPPSAGDTVQSLVRKIPWSRKWQPTPVLLPGKIHGQRSLVDYSAWSLKDLGVTEHAPLSIKKGNFRSIQYLCSVHWKI